MTGTLLTIGMHLLALSGNPVYNVYLQCGASVTMYDHSSEQEVIYTNLDAQVASDFPNVIKFYRATNRWNCHSFAFYKQNPNYRNYELYGQEVEYSALPYYTQVSFSSVVPGDRILYYSGVPGAAYLEHSGIVTKKLSGSSNYTGNLYGVDLVYVDSKWGERGLYKHRGHDCIYVGNHSAYNTTPATMVRFYHINYTHSHSYSYTQLSGDENFHFKQCACGGYYEDHNYVPYNIYSMSKTGDPQYISAYRCSKCHYISYDGIVSY